MTDARSGSGMLGATSRRSSDSGMTGGYRGISSGMTGGYSGSGMTGSGCEGSNGTDATVSASRQLFPSLGSSGPPSPRPKEQRKFNPQEGSFVEVMSPGTPGMWQKGKIVQRKGDLFAVEFPDTQTLAVWREDLRSPGADKAAYATDDDDSGSEESTRAAAAVSASTAPAYKFSGSDPQEGSFVEVMSPGTPGGWQKGTVATRKGEFSVVYFPDGQRQVVERKEMRPLGADTAAYATDDDDSGLEDSPRAAAAVGASEAQAYIKSATMVHVEEQEVQSHASSATGKPTATEDDDQSSGGGDVVAENDSIAGRDSSYIYHFNWSTTGGGGVVAGRKSGEVSPEHPRPSTPEYMADLEACALESELHHVREALAQAHHGQRIAEHVRDIIGHGIHGASSDDGLSDDGLSDGGPYSMGSADSPREAVLKRFEACY